MSQLPIVYTACFGEHDRPAEIPGLVGRADLVCFTDSESLQLETWTVLRRRPRFLQARMDAKWYKMSACHLFPDHTWSVYIDSSVRLHKTEGFLAHCEKAIWDPPEMRGVAFYSHPEGQRSIAEEAAFSMTMGKYHGEPLVAQAEHYKCCGFPGGELLAGGVIVREHALAGRFEKAWFDECVHWSTQDQVSLPFVLWREKISYGVLPGSIYGNEFLSRVWSGPDR